MKSEWPVPGTERGLRSIAPAPTSDTGAPVKPARVAASLRHDARSAAHTMRGFLDLFASGALGPLSPVQEQSLGHLYQAADRMRELVETAVDLGRLGDGAASEEPDCVLVSSLTQGVVRGLRSEDPKLALVCEPSPPGEEPCLLQPRTFETALRALLSVTRDQDAGPLEITLSQSDLHTTLTILACSSQPPPDESVSQSLPAHVALTSELDELAPTLRNRDYLRLKRCEALLEPQRGRLAVAPDLSRLRVLLQRAR